MSILIHFTPRIMHFAITPTENAVNTYVHSTFIVKGNYMGDHKW